MDLIFLLGREMGKEEGQVWNLGTQSLDNNNTISHKAGNCVSKFKGTTQVDLSKWGAKTI